MARPVEIDRAAAFEAGHGLFWERGYGGTSLADLLAAMDISRSSFYAAFDVEKSSSSSAGASRGAAFCN